MPHNVEARGDATEIARLRAERDALQQQVVERAQYDEMAARAERAEAALRNAVDQTEMILDNSTDLDPDNAARLEQVSTQARVALEEVGRG